MSIGNLKSFFGSLFSKSREDKIDGKKVVVNASSPLSSDKEKFKVDIFSPFDGELVDQKQIPDEAFAEGHMGYGVGINPTGSGVESFMTGSLEVLFKTKHAYIIKDKETDVSVLLHIGIDTVKIPEDKQVFKTNRKQGDFLKAHDVLCEIDLGVMKEEAKSTISPLLVQNDNMDGKKIVYHVKTGTNVKKGDLLMSVIPA